MGSARATPGSSRTIGRPLESAIAESARCVQENQNRSPDLPSSGFHRGHVFELASKGLLEIVATLVTHKLSGEGRVLKTRLYLA